MFNIRPLGWQFSLSKKNLSGAFLCSFYQSINSFVVTLLPALFDKLFVFTKTTQMLFVLVLFSPLIAGEAENDLVTNIPGVTFQVNFKTYSGYLNAGNNGTWRMHYVWVHLILTNYWIYSLHESQSDPDNDPVLLWVEGGPGCSGLGTLFKQLGPFYADIDGTSLFENPYSWNKKANLLSMESPIDVGFSYDTNIPNNANASDDLSRDQNYNALKDFFRCSFAIKAKIYVFRVHSRFGNRTFFIAGQSYAGIYIPMLADKIVQGINNGDFSNPNFQGFAIGNGFLNAQLMMNSLVIWGAYHGLISPQWVYLDNLILL